jgi:hypothetical protein
MNLSLGTSRFHVGYLTVDLGTEKVDSRNHPAAGAMRPSIGLLAVAYSFFGILPLKYASRPASQA